MSRTSTSQRLTQWPPGLFHPGHSGRRFSSSDIPTLRAMRDAYRVFLDALPGVVADCQADPGMLLAAATIRADLQANFQACGRALDLLERTPPAWRP